MRKLSFKFVILAFLISIFFAFVFMLVYSKLLPKKYMARSSIAIKKEDTSNYNNLLLSHYLAETVVNIYDNNSVLERAYTIMDGEVSKGEIKSSIKVTKKTKTILINVDAISKSPERASQISTAYAEAMDEVLAKDMRMIVIFLEPVLISVHQKSKITILVIGFVLSLGIAILAKYIHFVIQGQMASAENLKSKGYIVLGQALVDLNKEKRLENQTVL